MPFPTKTIAAMLAKNLPHGLVLRHAGTPVGAVTTDERTGFPSQLAAPVVAYDGRCYANRNSDAELVERGTVRLGGDSTLRLPLGALRPAPGGELTGELTIDGVARAVRVTEISYRSAATYLGVEFDGDPDSPPSP